eukprot:Opistho-2@20647
MRHISDGELSDHHVAEPGFALADLNMQPAHSSGNHDEACAHGLPRQHHQQQQHQHRQNQQQHQLQQLSQQSEHDGRAQPTSQCTDRRSSAAARECSVSFKFQSKYLSVSEIESRPPTPPSRASSVQPRPWCNCDICATSQCGRGRDVTSGDDVSATSSGDRSSSDFDAVELETNERGELEEVRLLCERPRLSVMGMAKYRKSGVALARHKLFVVSGDGKVLVKIAFSVGIVASGICWSEIYARMGVSPELCTLLMRSETAALVAVGQAGDRCGGGNDVGNQHLAWKTSLAQLLRVRDRREVDPFRPLVHAQTRLLQHLAGISSFKSEVRTKASLSRSVGINGSSWRRRSVESAVAGAVRKLLSGASGAESIAAVDDGEYSSEEEVIERPGKFVVGVMRNGLALEDVFYLSAEDNTPIAYRVCYCPGSSGSAHAAKAAVEGRLLGAHAVANVVWVVGPLLNSHKVSLAIAVNLATMGNVNVFVVDQRGHGMSHGVRGGAPHVNTGLRDVRAMVRHVRMNYCRTPIILAGHGMGATQVLNYAVWKKRVPVDGYAFFAPTFYSMLRREVRRDFLQHTDSWYVKRCLLARLSGGYFGNGPAIHTEVLFDNVCIISPEAEASFVREFAEKNDPPRGTAIPKTLSVNQMAGVVQTRRTNDLFTGVDKPFGLWYGSLHELFDPKDIVAAADRSRVSNKYVDVIDGIAYVELLWMAPELLTSWLRSCLSQ